jgi:hypothetical protein
MLTDELEVAHAPTAAIPAATVNDENSHSRFTRDSDDLCEII